MVLGGSAHSLNIFELIESMMVWDLRILDTNVIAVTCLSAGVIILLNIYGVDIVRIPVSTVAEPRSI